MNLPSVKVEAVQEPKNASTYHNRDGAEGYTSEEFKSVKAELDYSSPSSSFITTGPRQSTQLRRAVDILNKMLEDRREPMSIDETIEDEFIRPKKNCTIFLSITSNIISSDIREDIRFLVKNKLIDCLVTTTGGVEEDLIKCFGKTYVGDFKISGSKLMRLGIKKKGDLIADDVSYCRFKDWIEPIFHTMSDEVALDCLTWPLSKVIERLGKEINNGDSICYWAARNKIPVFCDRTSGLLSEMLLLQSSRTPRFYIDQVSDNHRLESFCRNTKKHKAGAIILGGGLAASRTLDASLTRKGLDYAVFIGTRSDGYNPNDAASWGNIKEGAPWTSVRLPIGIAFPLLVSQAFYRYADRL